MIIVQKRIDGDGARVRAARFLRVLAVYRSSFGKPGDVLVVDPATNSFFQNLREGGARAPSVPQPASETAP